MKTNDPIRFALFAAAALALLAGAPASAAGDPPETIRWPSSVGEVAFDHRLHAEELASACADCHHETVAATLDVPHPDYFDDFWVDCRTCHTGLDPAAVKVGRCAECHPRRAVGPHVETPTVKVAIHRSCWSCHDVGRGAEASAQCGFCHQPAPSAARAAGK